MTETPPSNEAAIVIGAGVIGSAVALELARAGHPTTVMERASAPGMGSTSASSAVIRFNYSTVAGAAMAYESAACWRAWGDHLGLPADAMLTRYVECGKVLIDDAHGSAQVTVEPLRAVGIPFEVLSADELEARFPGVDASKFFPPARADQDAFWDDATERVAEVIFTPEGGFVSDPQLAAQNLADAARAAGAVFRFGAEVAEIQQVDGAVAGVVLTDGEVVAAPIVVNVAGPHASHVNALAGVVDGMRVTTRPLQQQVDHAPAPSSVLPTVSGLPVFGDLDAGIYFRPEGDGVLIGGVEAECDPLLWLDDPDDAAIEIDSTEWETKTLRLARRVPAMGVPHTRRGLIGVYDVSDDWVPILDRSDLDGYFMACGTSGNQFKNAPTIGHCMAELIAAVRSGHDHDAEPVVVTGRHTGLALDLGTFSRLRDATASTGTVLG